MNQEQTNITTGKQIRHLRTQLGMTQEELAGELNVTRQALSNWERDVNEPDLNMLKKICFLFGVNMDDFAKEVITKMETYEKKEKRQFNKYDMAIGLFYGVGDYIAYMNQYDDEIASFGGIDLQILGIGSDGHIAFNEPGTPFNSLTHIAELAESTIKDNSRLFNDISEVPTKAVTMGLQSIMNARKIVLIATGKNKAEAIYNLLKGPMTEEVPCSILQKHPDCTIYVDEAAYSLVK